MRLTNAPSIPGLPYPGFIALPVTYFKDEEKWLFWNETDTPSQLNEGDGLISGEPLWPKRHLLLMLMSSGDNNWAQRGTGPQPASQTPSTLHGLSTICQTASGWTEDLATQSWGEDGGVGDISTVDQPEAKTSAQHEFTTQVVYVG
ncbi:unnamed protein product [Pleuronectes platessa]|uniref:Uncharacterized protein n=1 Tax=Pleuronectes platessa TaxID=8262 RepID=A0A9N7VHB0_PLEPL|nr:unnamed protein product [Pleuronectes platessa]